MKACKHGENIARLFRYSLHYDHQFRKNSRRKTPTAGRHRRAVDALPGRRVHRMQGREARTTESGADHRGSIGGGPSALFRRRERRGRIHLCAGPARNPVRLGGHSGRRRGLRRRNRADGPFRSDPWRRKRRTELSRQHTPHDRRGPVGGRLRHRRVRGEPPGQSQPSARPGIRPLRRSSRLTQPIGPSQGRSVGRFRGRRRGRHQRQRREHRFFEPGQRLDRLGTLPLVHLAPRRPRGRTRRARPTALSVVPDLRRRGWRSGDSLSCAPGGTRVCSAGNADDHGRRSNDWLAHASRTDDLAAADEERLFFDPHPGYATPRDSDGHRAYASSGRTAPRSGRLSTTLSATRRRP